MPEKRRRTPSEKKALSYEKDRRNDFGSNDKASRKNIPLSKAKGHRADRRKASASLDAYGSMDETKAALVENALLTDLDRLKRWKKSPDKKLGDFVERLLRRRKWIDEGRQTPRP